MVETWRYSLTWLCCKSSNNLDWVAWILNFRWHHNANPKGINQLSCMTTQYDRFLQPSSEESIHLKINALDGQKEVVHCLAENLCFLSSLPSWVPLLILQWTVLETCYLLVLDLISQRFRLFCYKVVVAKRLVSIFAL